MHARFFFGKRAFYELEQSKHGQYLKLHLNTHIIKLLEGQAQTIIMLILVVILVIEKETQLVSLH